MTERTEVIDQKRQLEAQLKQEEKREQATAEKQAVADAKKSDVKTEPKKAEAKSEKKQEAKPEAKVEKKEERKFVLDRLYTIPLSKAYEKGRSHRARVATSLVRQFASKHAKAAPLSVKISTLVNSAILVRGARHPPKSVRVQVRKDDKGMVSVDLAKA